MIEEKDIQQTEQPQEPIIPIEQMEEEPIIIIERVEDETDEDRKEVIVVPHPTPRWKIFAIGGIILLLIAIIVLLILRLRATPEAPELPVSTTSEANIEWLQKPLSRKEKRAKAEVAVSEDSINGVLFREYALKNLRAEISFDKPSDKDKSVYFYALSADVRADNQQVLDACVIAGEQVSQGNNRSGYMAALDGRTVIGVAKNDSVLDFIRDAGGHFFRQFALVSAGVQGDIRLKGKVERRALGVRQGQLYYIESLNKESLYDFAEALVDYGYTDAIYMTGGKQYSFYRDKRGRLHDIGEKPQEVPADSTEVVTGKPTYAMPYVVFKKVGK